MSKRYLKSLKVHKSTWSTVKVESAKRGMAMMDFAAEAVTHYAKFLLEKDAKAALAQGSPVKDLEAEK